VATGIDGGVGHLRGGEGGGGLEWHDVSG
jgi:hypothetical protein